jgi:hypothetical protein
MTHAARKVARSAYPPLALLLCVFVFAASVDVDGSSNDTFLRESTLAWADDDADDDADAMTSVASSDAAAVNARLSVVRVEDTSRLDERRAAAGLYPATSVDARGPPRSDSLPACSTLTSWLWHRSSFFRAFFRSDPPGRSLVCSRVRG